MKVFLLPILLLFVTPVFSQSFVTRDIKSFGAKGDGKTNDHDAFQRAAAFFNERGGNGKLVISKGTYIVGKQKFNKHTREKPVFEGETLLHFNKVSNLSIEGDNTPVIKYKNGLRFGSFDPLTGQVSRNGNNFFNHNYTAVIRNAIELTNCTNIKITDIELDGNSNNIIPGGIWGDVGRQLPHTGIWITNARSVSISNIYAHHFGLDGIVISNATGNSKAKDSILITDSRFEYNARQGLSWVGGNDLKVINSKFNHAGRGKFSSAPGAGVDIEAEVGPVRNGNFVNCEFINNAGCGLVADSGESSNCTFTDCTFWGVTSWSIWVRKPSFTFINSKIYGSIVHGYDTNNDAEATKFIKCHFEDKSYNNAEPYGRFLIETNSVRKMIFEGCLFVANKKKLLWIAGRSNVKPEEKYRLINCHFKYYAGTYPEENWYAVIRGTVLKNCTFEIIHPQVNKFFINGLQDTGNVDLGGNQFLINNVNKKLKF